MKELIELVKAKGIKMMSFNILLMMILSKG
jgi:hypothetical protein